MSYNPPVTEPERYGGPAGELHRRSTNGLAITSLVLGLAGFLLITIPLNLILGLVALVRTRRRNDKGTGLAIAGLVLSLLWSAGIGIGVASLLRSHDPKRDANGQITTPQKAGPDKLRVGDCVARSQTGEVADVQAQPCDRPGSDKVFAIFDLPGKPWPGETASSVAAEKGCSQRYEKSHQRATPAELSYFAPTRERWALGYHRVVCLAGTGS